MPETPTAVRIDVWLDVACIFKTRSEAKKALESGRVLVNDATAKPHRNLKVGDRILVHRPGLRDRTLVVRALGEHNVPKAEARLMYEDTTPPLTPEELEASRFDRLLRSIQPSTVGRPDRRARRSLRRARGRT